MNTFPFVRIVCPSHFPCSKLKWITEAELAGADFDRWFGDSWTGAGIDKQHIEALFDCLAEGFSCWLDCWEEVCEDEEDENKSAGNEGGGKNGIEVETEAGVVNDIGNDDVSIEGIDNDDEEEATAELVKGGKLNEEEEGWNNKAETSGSNSEGGWTEGTDSGNGAGLLLQCFSSFCCVAEEIDDIVVVGFDCCSWIGSFFSNTIFPLLYSPVNFAFFVLSSNDK